MVQELTLDEIDTALTECATRIRRAREARDREALIVYRAQANRLLSWRYDLTTRQPAGSTR